MSNRATSADVQKIIDFDTSISDLEPFITAANELVTEICASTGTAERLKLIETWLAAHFLAIRDPRYTSETIGQASASYAQNTGMNLSMTPYGQQAMLLDTKGGLAWLDKHISQGKRSRVGMIWLGTDQRTKVLNYPWRYIGLEW